MEKAPEHGQAPVGRSGFAVRMALCKISLQVMFLRLQQRQCVGQVQPVGEQAQIAFVGGQRVGRQTIFQPEGIGKTVDDLLAGGMHQSSLSFCVSTTFL